MAFTVLSVVSIWRTEIIRFVGVLRAYRMHVYCCERHLVQSLINVLCNFVIENGYFLGGCEFFYVTFFPFVFLSQSISLSWCG
jgi:hypothetical protein